MSELNKLANSISANRPVSTDKSNSNSTIGIVADVILDESHPAIKDHPGIKLGKNTSVIGAVVIKDVGDVNTRDEQFTVAYPYDRNFINLPVKNELVEIIRTAANVFYKSNSPAVNPNETGNKTSLKENRVYHETYDGTGASSAVKGYKNISKTGIPKTKGSSPYNDENYGKHYDVDKKLHRLKLYEGDSLIESRFGQSIRFSGYDNKDNKFYPSITIRNRENDLSKEEKVDGEFTLEDINRDGSIIILSSGKKILPFQPGTVDKSNKSDFKTKPKAWTAGTPKQKNKKFPEPLDGDQVLINSDRIILSSKKNEMIFYSKSNIGIISDAHWSWDLAEGIDGNIGGNWHVITNNHDFRTFNGTKGRNILGSGDNLQNIPRGNDLIEWLGQLVDLIVTNVYATPAGPTSPGPPNNIPKYQQLKAKLPRLLSKLNYTGNEPKPEGAGGVTPTDTSALASSISPGVAAAAATAAAAAGATAVGIASATSLSPSQAITLDNATFDGKPINIATGEAVATDPNSPPPPKKSQPDKDTATSVKEEEENWKTDDCDNPPAVTPPPPELIAAMRKWGITSPIQRAHFLAQVAHESGNFRFKEEIASGKDYEFRKSLGNTQPGDGPRYKGRGYIQLTGRANYTKFNSSVPDNVVSNPIVVATKYSAESACYFWKTANVGQYAKDDSFNSVLSVSRKVNGWVKNKLPNGWDDRKKKFKGYWCRIKKSPGQSLWG